LINDPSYAATTSRTIYSDPKTLVTQKGRPAERVTAVFTNAGAGAATRSLVLAGYVTGYAPYERYTNVVDCRSYVTDREGTLFLTLEDGLPLALYPSASLAPSTLCRDYGPAPVWRGPPGRPS
jgi:hypothetical protein